jgi:hypothetical protein
MRARFDQPPLTLEREINHQHRALYVQVLHHGAAALFERQIAVGKRYVG